ncbi:MAG TPA: LPS assembly protein LptD, partial [Beijerinckiaceae bacterium]
RYVARSTLGVGVSVPYFWALAPNYDVTVTPTVLTRQGVMGTVEWRHRLLDGAYDIRASGIFQQEPGAFRETPYGPGNMTFRGSLETKGEFNINKKWRVGWDVTVLSDRWFLQDYKLPNQNLSTNYFKEAISTVYLNGQADRGYFDLRGYRFQGLSRADIQEQQPLVAVLDYNKTFDVSPARSGGIGGQIEVDLNLTSITRELAAFEAIGGRRLDRAYNIFDVCEVYDRNNCLAKGLGGNYARATVNVSWKRQFIDPIGQVWTPFVFSHLNGTWLNLDATRQLVFTNPTDPGLKSIIANDLQHIFYGANDTAFRADLTPGAGIEYRLPLFGRSEGVTHVLEPIVQVIARPDTVRDRRLVNEDAQSLVFDDTSLFEWDKFSGYDRVEGGVRANLGAQYSVVTPSGWYANLMFGESIQIAGVNSFRRGDLANVGLDSGLENRRSDFVGRFQLSPNQNISFISRARFDQRDFAVNRFETGVTARFSPFLPLETSLFYSFYEAQPALGFAHRREGVTASATYRITPNWFVTGSALVDFTRYLDTRDTFADLYTA